MNEIYISIDVEADGPIPGDNSMLSFGAAAFLYDYDTVDPNCPEHSSDKEIDANCTCPRWKMIDTFEANLELLPDATPNADTMLWWSKQPEAWAACRKDLVPPAEAMGDFNRWVRSLPGSPVIVGYPVTYDFGFLYWYTVHFCGFPAPYGFQGLDIKTLVMDRMACPYKQATKRNMPKRWFIGAPSHTHVALDDAIGQGVLFMNLLKEQREGVR